jgi:hypothetical protein
MAETFVEVVQIGDVSPHPNADRLEVATVGGYSVVVGKGAFSAGDVAAYFPPNILLPSSLADDLSVTKYLKHAEFNQGEGSSQCRVAGCRLRGQPSFGFLASIDNLGVKRESLAVGQDISELIGAKKYEPPVRITTSDAESDNEHFHRYSEIENIQRHPNGIPEGTPVRITEKIHGCLHYKTRVSMADGSLKRIMDVEVGDEVLGMEDGHVVTTRVTNKFNNGKADAWLTVTGKRCKAGRGNHFFAVHCTPNHRFWASQKGKYVEAAELKPGDELLILRNEQGLTPSQEQVILGKLLGDGSIQQTKNTASVAFGHKVEHEEYVDWTVRALGDLGSPARGHGVSGYGTQMVRARTSSSAHILKEFGEFIGADRKVVPSWVETRLGPMAFAFWYMDDGSLSHNDGQEDRVSIATNGFGLEDCQHLQRAFQRFGIKADIYEAQGYRMRLNADDAEKFFLLIAPYVPPIMQYKLPDRYRGHDGWLPKLEMPYKPLLVPVTVGEVKTGKYVDSSKWDIETGTHNFFANGILVHNSNCRIGIVNGEYMAGSHRLRRKEPPEGKQCIYWEPLSPSVRRALLQLGGRQNSVILFGEIYGPGVQDMDYGVPAGQRGFRVFDISVNGQYVSWASVKATCDQYGIETVPLLYVGPFSRAKVDELTYGPTTLGEPSCSFKGREGVVITPLIERWMGGGRMILKSVSADYLDRKGAEDNE